MKVLIITYYWPPAGGSGVQRWLKFVKYLTQFDVEPIVYTVDNPVYAIQDESLENEVPKSVKILKQPIKEPNDILKFFGKKNNKTSAGFLNANPTFFGKIMQYIRANYFIPDARKYWIKPSVNYLTEYLKNNPVDVIISTGPPHSLHLIGWQLQKNLSRDFGIKWIADFRDPWTDIDYFHQLPLTKKAIQKHFQLEKEVVTSADKVLVIGNAMKDNFMKYNHKIEVLTNGYDDELNVAYNKTEKEFLEPQNKKKFTLTHIGLVNADRNPTILFKVLSELIRENENFANDFQLIFVGKLANEVIESINKFVLNPNVKIIDYVAHHKVFEFQKNAQVLLLLVNNVPSAKGIVTGKIFEYLQAKRPIVAIGPKDGDLAEIINNTNSGSIIDFYDERSLKNKIIEMYNLYKTNDLRCNSVNIEQYHRKALTKRLVTILNNVVS